MGNYKRLTNKHNLILKTFTRHLHYIDNFIVRSVDLFTQGSTIMVLLNKVWKLLVLLFQYTLFPIMEVIEDGDI